MNHFVRACLVFALALVPVLLSFPGGPGVARAHAAVVSTSPAGWAVLDTSPAEVSLTFSEPVDLGLATVRLVGPAGDAIGTAAPAHAEGRPQVLSVALPRVLSDGSYTVNWQVTSADTHPARGAFVFSVGRPSTSAPGAAVEADGFAVAAYGTSRWLSFAGFALLGGAVFFVAWCQAAAAAGRRVRVLLVSGWWVSVAATALVLLFYGPYATSRPITAALDPSLVADTIGTRLGVMVVARLLVLGLVGFALLWFLRRGRVEVQRGRRAAVVLGVTCLLAFTWSAASHSAAGSLVGLSLVTDAVHLTAMAVWLGGLVVVAAVVVRSDDVPGMRVAVPRFSRVALVSVLVLVVTGAFQSWRLVDGPSALVGTPYGRVLLGKLALVVVLLVLGAAARRWVRRHYGFPVVTVSDRRRVARGPGAGPVRRFGAVVAAEAGIATLVLALTAVLVTTDPAEVEQVAVAQTAPGEPVVADFDAGGAAGRGKVAALVAPGASGGSEVHVAVLDERGQPRQVAEVRATLSHAERSPGPMTVPLRYGGVAGHYISDALSLPVSGRWEMSLAIRTSDVDEAIVRVPVTIA
ncbi:copper resistance protein CopC/CopD [Saccharothrix sp. S26]|uniref:copper resistance CopC/CopD family protein n=1 Tax=Saccharothrix sp. S26 TaxID=2907215 RepID=UPI001F20C64E|nr:copper resistance protein CopC [Saccharothrix sp. S26]MCE6999245.1 copper resistance protein CopC/CopD [Saccharothrix sp. S26]